MIIYTNISRKGYSFFISNYITTFNLVFNLYWFTVDYLVLTTFLRMIKQSTSHYLSHSLSKISLATSLKGLCVFLSRESLGLSVIPVISILLTRSICIIFALKI